MFPHAQTLGPAGWYHLFVMGVFIPALVVRNYRRMKNRTLGLPNRTRHFRSTAFVLTLLTLVSVFVGRVESIDVFRVDPARLPAGLAAGALMYVATVVFMRPRWRRAVERRTRIVYLFMPETAAERGWWVFVSTLAGIGEEITWRGVQTALLVLLTGSYAAGAVLSAISFGVAHYIQGWKSAAIITVFALAFQSVVWLSGTLYIAMLVHVAYDITAGLTYGKLGRELGYTLPEAASPRA